MDRPLPEAKKERTDAALVDAGAQPVSAELLADLEVTRTAAPSSAVTGAGRRPLFILRVRESWLALDADVVEAVIPLETCAPIPFAPDHFEGVIIHGDRVLTVVDLGHFLGLPSGGATGGFGRVLVVHAAGMRAGLICDRATGVFEVDNSSLGAPRVLQGPRLVPYLAAEAETAMGLTGVLDTSALFAAMRYRE